MASEKFTFLIVSQKSEKTLKFQFNLRNLIIVFSFIILIIFLGFFSIYRAYKINFEYVSIKKDYEKMLSERNKVIQMTRDLNRINEMDVYVRNSLGISNSFDSDTLLNSYVEQNIPVSYIKNIPSFSPVSGFVSQKFNSKSEKNINHHTGLDIVAPLKTPFHSTADGHVLFSGWKYPFGNTIIIYHGEDYFSFYGHNFENLVFEKERVKRGQIIGLIGNSGETSGPHLHFEIWKNGVAIDPSIFISEYRLEN